MCVLQEPIAAALFGCCVLRRMAARMSRTMRAQRSAYWSTSDECEAFATALLEHCADTSEELADTLLVRRVRCLGERTVLQLAQSAEALKFISSSVVQVSLCSSFSSPLSTSPAALLLLTGRSPLVLVRSSLEVPRQVVVWKHRRATVPAFRSHWARHHLSSASVRSQV